MSTESVLSKSSCRDGLLPLQRRQAWVSLSGARGVAATSESNFAYSPPRPSASIATVGASSPPPAPASVPMSALLSDMQVRYVQGAFIEVFGNMEPLPRRLFRVPFLGVQPSILPKEARALLPLPSMAISSSHDRIVTLLAQLHGLVHAPQVANLALLFLTGGGLGEAETFIALEALLSRGRGGGAGGRMTASPTASLWQPSATPFFLSREEEGATLSTFRALVRAYFPQTSSAIESAGAPVLEIFRSWFAGFFVGWLPLEHVYCIVDAYLLEGPKILFRFALALLRLFKKSLKAAGAAAATAAAAAASSSSSSSTATTGSTAASSNSSTSSSSSSSSGVSTTKAVASAWEAVLRAGIANGDLYSFKKLSHAAYSGLSGLSRDVVDKLMHSFFKGKRVEGTAAGGLASGGGGPTALDAEASDVAWYNPKIVGIPCRLELPLTLSSAPPAPSASAVISAIRRGPTAALEGLYLTHTMHSSNSSSSSNSASASSSSASSASAASSISTAPAKAVSSAAFSIASSPALASLSAFLPQSVSSKNWACVYSTDTHGWSLEMLYRRCAGMAPVLVLMQAALSARGAAAAGSFKAVERDRATDFPGIKTFGFFAGPGIVPPHLSSSTTRAAAREGSYWYGGPDDFCFHLLPDLQVCRVERSAASVAAAAAVASGGWEESPSLPAASSSGKSAESGATSRKLGISSASSSASSSSGGGVGIGSGGGSGAAFALPQDHFLRCTNDGLVVGGIAGLTGRQVFYLQADLHQVQVSPLFLMQSGDASPLASSAPSHSPSSSTASLSAVEDVRMDILSLEVYAFQNRGGSFVTTALSDPSALTQSLALYKTGLDAYWSRAEESATK